ncbi:hypothetical protein [Candidatus Binatus sp.]|uniref:hypothetical protein n=1 Tax=Candidatus Binatus sp. TaxID=2811406 RepID=UPI003CC5F94C
MARIENALRRIRILLQLDGVEPIKDKLLIVEKEFQRALQGRSIDIPDIDAAPAPPRFGTLDLTTGSNQGSGPTRINATSGELRIRAFDGSTFALYEPEALQPFTRKLAKDLQAGDQICVFSPDFVDAAREKLNLTSNASEILVLYHRAVAEAAAKLPGSDINSKAKALRERILQNDPSLDLPGIQSVRDWIDVVDLIDAPRNEVRPHAPGDRRHYLFPADLAFLAYRRGMTPDLGNLSAMWRNHGPTVLEQLLGDRALKCDGGSLCDQRGGACPACIMAPEVTCIGGNNLLSRAALNGGPPPGWDANRAPLVGYFRLPLPGAKEA